MLQIVFNSFYDFLVVRTFSNKYSLRDKIKVQRVDVRRLFEDQTFLVIDLEHIPHLNSIQR